MITKDINGNNIQTGIFDTKVKSTEGNRQFLVKLFVDDTELNCDITRLEVTKGTCADLNNFTIGDVISNTVICEVLNLNESITNKYLTIQVGVNVGTEESPNYTYLQFCKVKVAEVTKKQYGELTSYTIKGFGALTENSNELFDYDLSYPVTLTEVLPLLSAKLGTTINTNLSTDSIIFDTSLYGKSCYQLLQIIASQVYGHVTEDNNNNIILARVSYDAFVQGQYTTDMMVQQPEITDEDFRITGVKTISSEASVTEDDSIIPEVAYTVGSPINFINKNSYMNSESFNVFARYLRTYWRPGNTYLAIGDPRIEGGDTIIISNDSSALYRTFVHQVTHVYTGGWSTTISAAYPTNIAQGVNSEGPVSSYIQQTNSTLVGVKEDLKNVINKTANLNYFWHNLAGAHVTDIPKEQYGQEDCYETLISSNGVIIQKVTSEETTKYLKLAQGSVEFPETGSYISSDGIYLNTWGAEYPLSFRLSSQGYMHWDDLRKGSAYYATQYIINPSAKMYISNTRTVFATGICGNNSTELQMSIPLDCMISSSTIIEVTDLRMNVRLAQGGYAENGGYVTNGIEFVPTSGTYGYTVTQVYPQGVNLIVKLKKNSGTYKINSTSTAVPNNSVICAEVNRLSYTAIGPQFV